MRVRISRTCPFCGWTGKGGLPRHLREAHNKTLFDFIVARDNLSEEDTICKINGCRNKRRVVKQDDYYLGETCIDHPHALLRGQEGTHHFSSFNRPKDENGNDIYLKDIINPFSAEGRKLYGLEDMGKRGSDTRLKLGLNPFSSHNLVIEKNGMTNIANTRLRSMLENGTISNSGRRDPNVISTLYVGEFRSENRLKLGRTRNLYKRLISYRDSNINFDQLYTFEMNELKCSELELSLSMKYSKFRSVLDQDKYPNLSFHSIGHNEFYDISILEDMLNSIKEALN